MLKQKRTNEWVDAIENSDKFYFFQNYNNKILVFRVPTRLVLYMPLDVLDALYMLRRAHRAATHTHTQPHVHTHKQKPYCWSV